MQFEVKVLLKRNITHFDNFRRNCILGSLTEDFTTEVSNSSNSSKHAKYLMIKNKFKNSIPFIFLKVSLSFMFAHGGIAG